MKPLRKPLWGRFACLAGLLAVGLVAHAQETSTAAMSAAPAALHDQRAAANAATSRRVLFWNSASVKAVQLDYTPPAAGESRIYLGVHWHFNMEGIEQGNRIADYVFDHGLVPPAGCGCH